MNATLGGIWDGITNAFNLLISLGKSWYNAIAGVVIFALTYVHTIMDWVCNTIQSLVSMVASLVMPTQLFTYISSGWTAAEGFLRLANYVFPVQETFVVISLLSALWVVASTYRFIKSWIPTVA